MERSRPPLVVFDLGGVLVPPEGSIRALAVALDVPAEALAAAYWRVRDDYDRGGPSESFWASVTGEVGRSADARDLDRIDSAGWSSITAEVTSLLADLGAAGTRLGVLSNAPASLASLVRASAWSSVIDVVLFSSDVGLMKPEPAIYRAAEEAFAASGADILFFDDRPVNVEGARQAGWTAEVWNGIPQARRVLAAAGALDG